MTARSRKTGGSSSTSSSAVGNRAERRHWDKYAAEARETFSEIDLGDGGDPIRVYVPSTDALDELNTAIESRDIWAQLSVFLGEDTDRFREVAGSAPATALMALLKDVMGDLGIVEIASGN